MTHENYPDIVRETQAYRFVSSTNYKVAHVGSSMVEDLLSMSKNLGLSPSIVRFKCFRRYSKEFTTSYRKKIMDL